MSLFDSPILLCEEKARQDNKEKVNDICELIVQARRGYIKKNNNYPRYLILSQDCREILLNELYSGGMFKYNAVNDSESFQDMAIVIKRHCEKFIDVAG
jgi:hypothetical protein